MPLVTLAYLAVAAGLLLGSGGIAFPGLAAAGLLAIESLRRRSIEGVSLAGLMVAGVVTGWSVARADTVCAMAIEKDGYATVLLREDAKPGASARGFAFGESCRVAIRVRAATPAKKKG